MGLVLYAAITITLLAIAFELQQLQMNQNKLISADVKAYVRSDQVPSRMRVENQEWQEFNSFHVEDYFEFIVGKTIIQEQHFRVAVAEKDVVFGLALNFDHRNAYRYKHKPIDFYVSVFQNIVAHLITICLLPLVYFLPRVPSFLVQVTDGMIITGLLVVRGGLALMLACFGINPSFLF